MFFENRQVRDVVVTVRGSDQCSYALVVYTDGGYGITRDGLRIEALYWSEGRMAECIEHLLRVTGLGAENQLGFGSAQATSSDTVD